MNESRLVKLCCSSLKKNNVMWETKSRLIIKRRVELEKRNSGIALKVTARLFANSHRVKPAIEVMDIYSPA